MSPLFNTLIHFFHSAPSRYNIMLFLSALTLCSSTNGSQHTSIQTAKPTATELKKIFGERWTSREELMATMLIAYVPCDLIKIISSYNARFEGKYERQLIAPTLPPQTQLSMVIEQVNDEEYAITKRDRIILKNTTATTSDAEDNHIKLATKNQVVIGAITVLNHDRIAIGCDKGSIQINKINPQFATYLLPGPQSPSLKSRITALLFLADKNHLISGDVAGTITTWDLTTGRRLPTTEHQHTKAIMALVPFGNGIAAASFDSTITLWENGHCIQTLTGHSECVNALLLMPNGDLLSGSSDCSIKRWDKTTLRCTMTKTTESPLCALCLLTNTLLVAAGLDNGNIIIFDPEKPQNKFPVIQAVTGKGATIKALAELPNGKLLVGSRFGEVVIYR